MYYEKKQVTKEDGRCLVFYHFPDTATKDQTAAFEAAEAYAAKAAASAEPAAATSTRAAAETKPKEGGV